MILPVCWIEMLTNIHYTLKCTLHKNIRGPRTKRVRIIFKNQYFPTVAEERFRVRFEIRWVDGGYSCVPAYQQTVHPPLLQTQPPTRVAQSSRSIYCVLWSKIHLNSGFWISCKKHSYVKNEKWRKKNTIKGVR